ncbi:hypothetical protein GCM10028786_22500 [Flaviaesturariibacter terrae]
MCFPVQYNPGLANMRAGAAEPALKMRTTSPNLSLLLPGKARIANRTLLTKKPLHGAAVFLSVTNGA